MDLVLTPEDRKTMDEQLELVTRNLSKIDGSVADLRPKIERLVLERDVALGALALAVMREEKTTSTLKQVRAVLLSIPGFIPSGAGRVDRCVRLINDTLRELDAQIPSV